VADFDSPWKEALDYYFEAFLAFFFPQAHAAIDWSRGYQFLDKELQQVTREAELGRRVVDKLVQVWLKSGQEEWVLIHVEVQAQVEEDFPLRLFVYHYRLFDKYNRKVASLAVLADEREDWRPESLGYELWGCRLAFHFPVVKLLDWGRQPGSLETSNNPFALLVLAHLKTQETRANALGRQAWKLRLVKSLYERGFSRAELHNLFRFIDWLMDLPQDLENSFWQEIQHFEEEKRMPFVTSVERIGMERGKKIGLEEGYRQGILDGIAFLLENKFGSEGKSLLKDIQGIEDTAKLKAIFQGISTALTQDDLRKLWQ
jgi:hypothetical protein